jgi:hypothetical protein
MLEGEVPECSSALVRWERKRGAVAGLVLAAPGGLARGVFRDEPPDLGHERTRDFNHGQPALRVCRFVFGDGFFFGLALVVCQQPLNSLLVPAGREMLFLHLFFLPRRRRLRYASNGLPVSS